MILAFLLFCFRQVYSSVSFIIPVITFTLVYNIPKFFELVTVTTVSDTGINNSLKNCVETTFYRVNESPIYKDNETMGKILLSKSTNYNMSLTKSQPRETIFSIGEEFSKEILTECCNCTNNILANETGKMKCDLSAISGLISRLIDFVGHSQPNNNFGSIHTVLNVNQNMHIFLSIFISCK